MQQRLDRATLVHCAVTLGDLIERQCQVKYLSRVYLTIAYELDELG